MALESITLQQVVKKCLEDAEFFEDVVRNPGAALQKAGLTLSAEERVSLESMVSNVKVTDVPQIRDLVERFRALVPRDWEPGWPSGWLPRVK